MIAATKLAALPVFFQSYVADITPPVPLPLGGYTSRGTSLGVVVPNSLHASVTVFRQGSTKVALVSAEMLTVPESLVEEVKRRLPSDVALMLCATHTHNAPDSQMLNRRMTLAIPGIAKFNPEWLKWYADRLAFAVQVALARQPQILTQLKIAKATVRIANPRREHAKPDVTATWVRLNDKSGFVFATAHPTVNPASEIKTDGDWPGRVRQQFSAPVFNGAIGDVSPRGSFVETLEQFQRLREAAPVLLPVSSISLETIPIRLDPVAPHPTFAVEYRIPEAFALSVVRQFAPPTAFMTVFKLGGITMIGVPGEPTSEIGRDLQGPGHNRFVISNCNGWIGYILSPRDYDKGGYEATLAFHGRLTGQRVVESVNSKP